MLTPQSPVTAIPMVGDKYQKLLQKLDIETVEDLIYHFPFRYNDYSNTKPIREIRIGDIVTIKGTLEKVDNIYTKNRKRLTRAKIEDETGTLEAIWFNQHYLKRTLKPEETYNFSGKIDWFSKKPCLISPEFEMAVGATHLNTGCLVPIYPETRGVSSKWLRTRINDVINGLANSHQLQEFLPAKIVEKYNLKEFEEALKEFHFPKTLGGAKNANKRFSFEEVFLELLKVEERKTLWKKDATAVKITHNVTQQKKIAAFVQNLPFSLTASQKTAVTEILDNITQKHPMNRLLEGDVGSGKTIVAIIASYLTYLNGYKVLYMAPTEILAKQHFETFKTFLKGYDVEIALLTGSNKAKAPENADILIGTHALLYLKNTPENIGLVVIDEQHRFGVEQRAQLNQMCKNTMQIPHTLTMTATPIPRTLALTLYGDLDISTLKEVPNIGKKITSKVIPEKLREKAYKWVKNRNESTFIVCPLIEESEHETMESVKAATAEFENLREGVFKSLKMGLLHGKMKAKEKQDIVEKFRNGEITILVSTPVVEVGIDIPKATIMIVESAERYGLASLHQLRGRVGRGEKEGYCFLFMSRYSKKGYARLKNLERIDNGLELAEIDMKYRGQGDIYGITQHGFKRFKVADIYDLGLLEQAKLEAQSVYPKLRDFPLLKAKVERKTHKMVAEN